MNEHIGRLQAIGLGKETASGTPVPASVWIPKVSAEMKPVFEKAQDDSSYGVIDEIADSQTTKNMTEVSISGILRDNWIGNLLRGALGKSTHVICLTFASISGGTPARGDVVSSISSSWTGILKKIVNISGTLHYFVETTSGTLTTAKTDFTNGTWTATETIVEGVEGHLFERLNTNNHPSFTLYGNDPVGAEYSAYCMVDSFELETMTGAFGKFNAKFKGKQLKSASVQNPVYVQDTPFLAKHAGVSFATDEAGLNSASESSVTSFKLSIAKNVVDIQALGNTDVASLHNQQFTIAGDLEALYNSTIYRDFVANSQKKACRLALINDESTALATGIYPSLYVDMASLAFEEWSKSSDNNGLVKQTMGFTGEFKASEAMTLEILLLNDNSVGY